MTHLRACCCGADSCPEWIRLTGSLVFSASYAGFYYAIPGGFAAILEDSESGILLVPGVDVCMRGFPLGGGYIQYVWSCFGGPGGCPDPCPMRHAGFSDQLTIQYGDECQNGLETRIRDRIQSQAVAGGEVTSIVLTLWCNPANRDLHAHSIRVVGNGTRSRFWDLGFGNDPSDDAWSDWSEPTGGDGGTLAQAQFGRIIQGGTNEQFENLPIVIAGAKGSGTLPSAGANTNDGGGTCIPSGADVSVLGVVGYTCDSTADPPHIPGDCNAPPEFRTASGTFSGGVVQVIDMSPGQQGCCSTIPIVRAHACGNPEYVISVDLRDQPGPLWSPKIGSQLYVIAEGPVEDDPVDVEWVEETCPENLILESCSDPTDEIIADPKTKPPDALGALYQGTRYKLTNRTSIDPVVPVQWINSTCDGGSTITLCSESEPTAPGFLPRSYNYPDAQPGEVYRVETSRLSGNCTEVWEAFYVPTEENPDAPAVNPNAIEPVAICRPARLVYRNCRPDIDDPPDPHDPSQPGDPTRPAFRLSSTTGRGTDGQTRSRPWADPSTWPIDYSVERERRESLNGGGCGCSPPADI